jgi:hydrogenase maturation factor
MYGEASQNFKELCKIHEAEVIEKRQESLIVKYGNKKRAVSGFLVPDAEKGDKVRIHFAFAVEKIN